MTQTTAHLTRRSRWHVLAALTPAQTCHGLDRAVIGLVQKPIDTQFHLTGAQLGLLAGPASGLSFAQSAIPFGHAVDRFARTRLLTGAPLAWSAATALCATAAGYTGLLGARAAIGLAEAGGSPTGLLGSVGGLGADGGVDRIHARAGGFDSARTAWLGAIIPIVTAISGLAVAAVQTSANLIGVGLGTWLIGQINDVVGGRNGIASGIGVAMIFCIFGGVFLLLAARQIRAREPGPAPI